MSPQPLRDRILAALSLRPMTVHDLAICLSASHWTIRKIAEALHEDQILRRFHWPHRANGRPALVYEVRA